MRKVGTSTWFAVGARLVAAACGKATSLTRNKHELVRALRRRRRLRLGSRMLVGRVHAVVRYACAVVSRCVVNLPVGRVRRPRSLAGARRPWRKLRGPGARRPSRKLRGPGPLRRRPESRQRAFRRERGHQRRAVRRHAFSGTDGPAAVFPDAVTIDFELDEISQAIPVLSQAARRRHSSRRGRR
jgi:hypothetical protein